MKAFDPVKATDSQLIVRFEECRDEQAFAEIVRRHGPMVLATANRITRNVHDAEEAFQATFLALSKNCSRLESKASLVGWLHQAAQKTAFSIRRAKGRRIRRENSMQLQNEVCERERRQSMVAPAFKLENEEVAKILDKEISRLPEIYQLAVLSCDVEGMSQAKAAKQIGIPARTLGNHLSAGRKILRKRLAQRGIVTSLTGVSAYSSSSSKASAALAESLVCGTTETAMLFVAGKSAAEIGVSNTVLQAANKILTAMTKAKVTALCVAAVLGLFSAGMLVSDGNGFSSASAGVVVFDDFNDGRFDDIWSSNDNFPGNLDASSGDLIIGPGEFDGMDVMADAVDVELINVSARSQLKVTESGGSSTVGVRNSLDGSLGYFMGVGHFPDFGGSLVMLGRSDANQQQELFSTVVLPYDVRQEDTIVQIDVFGNNLRGWYWRPGESPPSEPQFDVTDDTHDTSGTIRLINSNRGEPGAPGTSRSIFRFVHIADEHIPLTNAGDLDSDGTLSVADIDAMSSALRTDNMNVRFDLNNDGEVNLGDLSVWVSDLAMTFFGDSNLDGEFNSSDLVNVFQAGKFESGSVAGWNEGDWNGDGVFDSSDFVVAFQDGGFEQGAKAVLGVPEVDPKHWTSETLL